ncbi:MAG: glycosyl transferase family 2 [Sphingobacterium multivorum]|jgi:rhamnosyltransferase|nr:glycosyl transferase family 2 [Sphingobacterium multivorum]
MTTLVLIITYNPDVSFVVNNLQSFVEEVSILIVDNASSNFKELEEAVLDYSHVGIIMNKENLGIAKALNQGLNYAEKNSFDYILTMDQDSSFVGSIQPLFDGFSISERVAVVCPSIFDVNSHNYDLATSEYQKVFLAITSGCLCKVESLLKVGGFEDKLFIDYVDFEICLRLQTHHFLILRSREAVLNHSLGESRVYKLAGIKFISTNHNSLRRYYNARNRIFLARKYGRKYPKLIFGNLISFFKTQLIIVFFEKNKKAKLKAVWKGIADGLYMN